MLNKGDAPRTTKDIQRYPLNISTLTVYLLTFAVSEKFRIILNYFFLSLIFKQLHFTPRFWHDWCYGGLPACSSPQQKIKNKTP